MAVRKAGAPKQRGTLGETQCTLLRTGRDARQTPMQRGADESEAGLSREVEPQAQVLASPLAIAAPQLVLSRVQQQGRFVPTRACRACQRKCPRACDLGLFEAARLGEQLRHGGLREDLDRHHAHALGVVARRQRFGDRSREIVLVPEALPFANRDAALEVVERTSHPALGVPRVAEPAQRACLTFHVTALLRILQRQHMLRVALRGEALREEEIAPGVMYPRTLDRELEFPRNGLGLTQRLHRGLEVARDAVARRHAHPRSTSSLLFASDIERSTEHDDGVARTTDFAEQLALQQRELARRDIVARRCRFRQRSAALRQAQRRLEAQTRGLLPGGAQVGLRRAWIVGPFEVLGLQDGLAVAEPPRSDQMDLAPAALQRRRVNRLLDKRVGEHEVHAVRSDEVGHDQPIAAHARVVGDSSKIAEREALADRRGHLQGRALRCGESVHALEDKAADGRRHIRRRSVHLLRRPQQLFEEERIAFGTLDALQREAARGFDQPRREQARLLLPQRRKVQGHERAAVRRGTPRLVERVAFDAGGEEQDDGRQGRGTRDRGQMAQQLRRAPMDVLDENQLWACAGNALQHCGQRLARTAQAGRVVHRCEDGCKRPRLRQVQPLVDEKRFVSADHATLDRRLQHGAAPRSVVGLADAQQRLQHGGNGVLALADTEVQDLTRRCLEASLARMRPELIDEPRLADARVTPYQHGRTAAGLAHGVEHAHELTHFRLATHEGEALGTCLVQSENFPDFNGSGQAFDRLFAMRLCIDSAGHVALQRAGNQRLPRLGQRVQPRREIDRIARDRILGLAAPTDGCRHHLAVGDADVQAERHTGAIGQLTCGTVHCERSPKRAQGVVAVRYRCPENGHDRVSSAIEDPPAVGFNDLVHRVEEAAEHLSHLFGITARTQRRVAGDVGEQHGRLPPVGAGVVRLDRNRLAPRRDAGLHRTAALDTELGRRWELVATGHALARHRAAAFLAEPGKPWILVLTVLAQHGSSVARRPRAVDTHVDGDVRPYTWLATSSAAQASSATPSGALRCRPQARFFSMAITAASSSIQPRLPAPTANISSISAQQQPTQNSPW